MTSPRYSAHVVPPQVTAQRGPPRALPRSATPGAPHGCCVLLTNQWAHDRFGLTPLRDGLNAWERCEKMLDQLAGTRAACAAAPQVKGEL